MLYVALQNLNQDFGGDHGISIVVECKEKLYDEKGGVSVDFFAADPNEENQKKDPKTILFHFNPRPPNRLILNTFKGNSWQTEVVLTDDEFKKLLFEKPFDLTIKLTGRQGIPNGWTEFGVFVNKAFLTTYLCPVDITTAKYVGFSPNLRISASKNNFNLKSNSKD